MLVIYHTISFHPTVTTQSSASIFYKFYKFAHPNPLFCLVFKTKEGSLEITLVKSMGWLVLSDEKPRLANSAMKG